MAEDSSLFKIFTHIISRKMFASQVELVSFSNSPVIKVKAFQVISHLERKWFCDCTIFKEGAESPVSEAV